MRYYRLVTTLFTLRDSLGTLLLELQQMDTSSLYIHICWPLISIVTCHDLQTITTMKQRYHDIPLQDLSSSSAVLAVHTTAIATFYPAHGVQQVE